MASPERHKIFAGNLPPDCTAEELKLIFGIYGNVVDLHLMNNNKSNSGQGCAFVVFDRKDSCESAIAQLDGICKLREEAEIPPMRVSWARPGGGGGGAAGGFGGGFGGGCGGYGGGGKGGKGAAWAAPWHAGQAAGWANGGGAPHAAGGNWNPQRPPAPAVAYGAKSKLFVGNLPQDVTPEVLQVVFQNYGTVTNIHVMAGRSRSGQACAFIEYATPSEAEIAVVTLHEKYEIKAGEGPIAVKFASSGQRAAPY